MKDASPNDQLHMIFDAASTLEGTERDAYLNEACQDDTGLRQEVESLLQALEGAGDFLKDPSIDSTNAFTAAVELNEGDVIDEYRLLEKIGEGSNAVVFMVEQIETIRRRAAMKVIKLGMDTREVIARFEAERQALALMDHPNIAKVLDAGTTHSGRPYFIMELVKGIPITDYCDQNLLSTEERLNLFIQVCLALQHAHLKGIIHRDIKPSNVLVTLHDGVPVPKVIDFGIAKATETRLTDKTLFTRFHQFIGTPAYMSPEQAEMSGLDIDTRSDIYSLGVLLYELLSGSTPFDGKELIESGYARIQQTIREKIPEAPSTRVNTLRGEGLTAVSKNRSIEPDDLGKGIKGDLDWIVLKALEKDRTRRYESATELARDIRRHLADEPVKASPPSRIYKCRKFLRRHRAATFATLAIVLSLLAGLVVAGVMWRRSVYDAAEAKRQAEKANAVTGLLDSMFQSAGPDAAKGDGFTVRELLDDYSKEFAGREDLDPEVEMTVRHTVATAYDGLGDYVQAEPHARRAHELALQVFGEDSENAMQTLSHLGWLIYQLGGTTDGLVKLTTAESWQRQHLDASDKKYQLTLCYLADIYASGSDLEKAREMAQQVLTSTQPEVGEDASPIHLWATQTLANVYRSQGQIHQAEKLLQSFISTTTNQDTSQKQHPRTIEAMHTACRLQIDLGNLREAEALAHSGHQMAQRALGEKHRTTLLLLGDLAHLDFLQERFEEAETRWEKVLTEQYRTLGEQHQDTIQSMLSLATLESVRNRLPKAEILVKKAHSNASGTFGTRHSISIESLSQLAQVIAEQGRFFEARQIFERVYSLAQESLGENHEITLLCANRLAHFESQHGNIHKANTLYHQIFEQYRRIQGDNGEFTLNAGFEYARFLKEAGRYAEALDLASTIYKKRQSQQEQSPEQNIAILRELAAIQKLRQIESAALQFLNEALTLARKELGLKNQITIELMREYAEVNVLLNDPTSSLSTLSEALSLATEHLGNGHSLTRKIKTDHRETKRIIDTKTTTAQRAQKGYLKALLAHGPRSPDLFNERNRFIELLAQAPEAASESQKLIQTNIDLSREIAGEKSVQFFRALHLKARNAEMRQQYELADQYYREVINAQYAVGWENHQRTHTTFFALSELLIRLNKFSDQDTILDAWQDKLHKAEWSQEQVQILIPRRHHWRYRRYLQNQGTHWRTTPAKDLPETWNSGQAPFGYGIRGIGTMPLTDGDKRAYYTTCFHREFHIEDPKTFQTLKLRLRREDGASVFINGEEVLRSNLHETAIGGTRAMSRNYAIARNVHYVYLIPPKYLKKGTNIISVELHQSRRDGSYMAFDLQLEALRKPSK